LIEKNTQHPEMINLVMYAEQTLHRRPIFPAIFNSQPVADRGAVFRLGLKSMLGLCLAPLGGMAANFHRILSCPARLEHGLIIILPGIEGCSSVNDSIARGLVAGQLSHAIQIIDWRRFRPWNPLHLAMQRHNRTQARAIAELIVRYQCDFPGQPVHLIGHSAGAGMALFVLEHLSEDQAVTSVTLLSAAVSRRFDVERLLDRTTAGIWNFYSPLDLPTVGIGTMLFGTMDRRHAVSAGALGFQTKHHNLMSSEDPQQQHPRLNQIPYQKGMAKSWNFGGHFGSTNAVLVRDNIVPICRRC
jgi:pimeloyl-ACP methyl ester carboxylesterase